MKTTKGGKVMNPDDDYRKEIHKRGIKRNKKERKKVREVGILKKDPEQIKEQIMKLDMSNNILEESVDQHFHTLIQTRHVQRRRDVVDESLTSEFMEEMGDSMLEPPEVQEVMEETGKGCRDSATICC